MQRSAVLEGLKIDIEAYQASYDFEPISSTPATSLPKKKNKLPEQNVSSNEITARRTIEQPLIINENNSSTDESFVKAKTSKTNISKDSAISLASESDNSNDNGNNNATKIIRKSLSKMSTDTSTRNANN